jgi:hypothetical protein
MQSTLLSLSLAFMGSVFTGNKVHLLQTEGEFSRVTWGKEIATAKKRDEMVVNFIPESLIKHPLCTKGPAL